MVITLFFLRAERTLCRLQHVANQNLRSPFCSTLVIHSTHVKRQRTLAVDSIDSGGLELVVCRGLIFNFGIILMMQHPLPSLPTFKAKFFQLFFLQASLFSLTHIVMFNIECVLYFKCHRIYYVGSVTEYTCFRMYNQ